MASLDDTQRGEREQENRMPEAASAGRSGKMSMFAATFLGRFRFEAGEGARGFRLSRWLFLRLLGCVYLAAFLSLWVQIHGLIGSRGISPVGNFLVAEHQAYGARAFLLVPTLCWFDPSDAYLSWLCGGGTVLAALLIIGVAPVPVLFLLWSCYLSLTVAGQQFLGYQWDTLLLETGFLAIFLAPLKLWPRLAQEAESSRVVLWLFRWLLFRLMFASGAVKLMSGDPNWRNLTALQYHYETQPLPPLTAWYMHQLPGWFQQCSVLATFAGELILPLFAFLPRPFRHLGCSGLIAFQLLILATGNYGFFNLLCIALCVLLLDDAFYPSRLRARLAGTKPPGAPARKPPWREWLLSPLAAAIVGMSLVPFVAKVIDPRSWPNLVLETYFIASRFESVNTYGLFAVMTTERDEILVEGSDDGQTWKAYDFKWKPGDLKRCPGFTTPHMPRLDWQMWFASLGTFEQNPWFGRFLLRLLEGSPDVLGLLEHNPFPKRPPRYVRASFYRYHFTNFAERRESGAWWRREARGLYCPALSLQRLD
jgi:hypothetical protein